MKTIKVMSIIGIVVGSLSFLCLLAFDNPYEYDAAIGWGIIAVLYFIPFSIVGLTHANRNNKK
jgi:uncharacterized membrane protein